ncbi:uncharacterized protein SOCE26_067370 [Sorangium cellulosum]|uniref:Uncharacterized protein n=1 Tax=Sorangium cellulosum TaxID=56 RepID=A0A2L0F147_SORCE|nr:uncharacterized protein SOCE26_067370 [Sorangium cellulosum]
MAEARPTLSLSDGVPAVLADGETAVKGIYHCKFIYDGDGYSEAIDSITVHRYFGNEHGKLDKAVSAGAVVERHRAAHERDGRERARHTVCVWRVPQALRGARGRRGGHADEVRPGRPARGGRQPEGGGPLHRPARQAQTEEVARGMGTADGDLLRKRHAGTLARRVAPRGPGVRGGRVRAGARRGDAETAPGERDRGADVLGREADPLQPARASARVRAVERGGGD